MVLRTLTVLLMFFVVVDLQVLNIGDLKNLDPKKVAEMIKRKAAGLDDDMDFSRGARKDNIDDDDDDDDEDDDLWDIKPKKEPTKPDKKATKAAPKKASKKKTEKGTTKTKKTVKKPKQPKKEVNLEPEVVEGEPINVGQDTQEVKQDTVVVQPEKSENVEQGKEETFETKEEPKAESMETDPEDAAPNLGKMNFAGEKDPNVIAQKMAEEQMRNAKPGETVVTYSPPILDDEESYSIHMPEKMRCDGCMAVVYALYEKFDKFNAIHKFRKYELPESDVIDLTEQACDGATYESYGIKTIKGEKRLSGPGLDTADVPGVTAGGGKWPIRLRDMCETFMGEIGEMAIYSVYKKNPKSRRRLEDYLCRGKGLRGECNKKSSKKAKDEL